MKRAQRHVFVPRPYLREFYDWRGYFDAALAELSHTETDVELAEKYADKVMETLKRRKPKKPDPDPKPEGVVSPMETLARAAHEVNRAYCEALGDFSQTPWERAPEWQVRSAVNGAEGVLKGNTPEESHVSWLEEKRAWGWTYGAVKDPEKKEHPCFVSYAELPIAQKQKDELFVGTVRMMAKALGMTEAIAAEEDK